MTYMRLARIGVLITALLGMAGCSSGTQEAPVYQQIFTSTANKIKGARAARAPRQVLTRALLDTLEEPHLEVTLERNDQRAFLTQSAARRDDAPGQIDVWRTADNITLAFRAGILISTRGLGGDLISSAVQAGDSRAGPVGSGARAYHLRTRDAKARRLSVICELSDLGPVTLEIVGHNHATRHLRETCISPPETGAEGRIVNDYWIDSRQPILWQSRQWAGPYIGYLRTRQLTR